MTCSRPTSRPGADHDRRPPRRSRRRRSRARRRSAAPRSAPSPARWPPPTGAPRRSPSRRTRTRLPDRADLGDHPAEPVGDLVEVDVLLDAPGSGSRARSRSSRPGGPPPRAPPWRRRASIRRACSRSSAATVCRLFFTRWWISRIVASLVTSSRSRRRRSVTSRSRTSAPSVLALRAAAGSTRTISDHVVGADLGVAVGAAAEHRAERLLVGAAARRHQLAGQRRPARARRGRRRARAGGRPTARSGSRRRPGPSASTRRNPSPTRGESAWSLRWPGFGKCPCGDHLGQVGGGLEVGQLQPARRAHAEQVGVAGDHRDHPAAAAHRDRLDPHRHVVAPLGVALADQPALGRTPRRAAAAARPARTCRPRRRRSAVGPVVGRIWPAAQKPWPSRSGSHSTRSAKDRSAMICQSAISSCSHADVLVVEVGVAAHQLDEGRHRSPAVVTSGSPPGRTGSPPRPVAG